jgi:hypothetical protein
MLKLKKILGAVALIALFAVGLSVGMGAAHAQGVCYSVALHPFDWQPVYTPFGTRWVKVPCVHIVTQCQ